MPHYNFKCKKCKHEYSRLCSIDRTEKYSGVKCPECGSKSKERVFSWAGGMVIKNPRTSSKWDNFSYRAGYTMEEAKNERRVAEEKSHMGTNPYNEIDDLNNGDYFGEIK